MLSRFRRAQSSLPFSPAILSRRQSAGHSTFMVVIDVTALRERAPIGREKNVNLYCVQGGSKAPYCFSKAMNVQKTDTSVQNSHFFPDRKSTRLNSSHVKISYAVFCLK